MEQKIVFEEEMSEISPNLLKTIILDIQKVQHLSGEINIKKITSRHTEVKFKDKILKAIRSQKKMTLYKEE